MIQKSKEDLNHTILKKVFKKQILNNKKKAGIIIVNWNGKRFLSNCLNAVKNQNYTNFQIYLVDNGSNDNSIVFVKKNFPEVKIIELDKNYGFARANNIGIKQALEDEKIQYIVCLNNDTIVQNDWLRNLIETAESQKNIGAVTSKAYFKGGRVIQNAGLVWTYSAHPFNNFKHRNGSIGYGYTDIQTPELCNDTEIFIAGGVAPLYKRKVLEEIFERDNEFFDEHFFAYTEDYDIGFRIRKLGYKCYLSANAKLIHLHSQTGGKASPFKAYFCTRNAILTAIKNLTLKEILVFPIKHLLRKGRNLKEKDESITLLKTDIGLLKMMNLYIRAYVSAIKLTPKMIKKRRRIYEKQ